MPPIFNQDDAQQVTGVSLGIAGRVLRSWDVTANVAYLDSENLSQNTANQGKRLTLTPQFSGSVWTTYTTPWRLTVGGGVRFTDERSSTPPTPSRRRATRWWTRWRPTTCRARCRCG